MGAGALNSLPDKVNEDQAKFFSGDLYNRVVFESIKDGEGFVTKEQLQIENEAYRVFKLYCPDGTLESKQFIKLCKDLKLLDKKFTSGDADLTFTKALRKNGVVKYDDFRVQILDDIASKKGKDVNQVVKKLSEHEGPILTATVAEKVRFHDDSSTFTGAQAKNFKNNIEEAGDAELRAAVVIQNQVRAKIAVNTTKELKEVMSTVRLCYSKT